MNKKKFYNIFSIILSATTVLYGFEALAISESYQDNSPHHFYIQGGFESPSINANLMDDYVSGLINGSLFTGYHYQLESANRLRGELEVNFNSSGAKILSTSVTNISLPKILINVYYDVSISKVKGLYINFGSGIGIDRTKKSDISFYTTGTVKSMFGTEYYMTDHFSISNQLYLSSSGNNIPESSSIFMCGKLSLGMFVGLKYTF